MSYLFQFIIIVFYYKLGVFIKIVTNTIIPGSVIGMLLLFITLLFGGIKLTKIEKTANLLLNNLSLFFVPAGVGLLVKFSLIKNDFINILIVLISTTIISQITAIFILKLIKRGENE